MSKVVLRTFQNGKGDAVLQMEVDGEPKAHMIVDPGGLSDIIAQLAILRAAMADEIAKELDPGFRLDAVYDPIWRGQVMEEPKGALLALRHPGLGWVSALFPEKEARGIATFLTDAVGKED